MICNWLRYQLKDRDGDQRGGSEWEPIKILSKENSAYVLKSLPSVLHTCCQDHVAITVLLTLGTTQQLEHSKQAAEQTTRVQRPAPVRLVQGWVTCPTCSGSPGC